MANSDKDILITPNRGQTAEPLIKWNGANNTPLYTRVLDDGTISFEGTAGQLFSISDGLTGTIFSVNDISGIPSIEVLDTGEVRIAQYSGNVGIGKSSPTTKLDVSGVVTGTSFASTVATGAAPLTVASTTVVTNLNADLWDGYNVSTRGNWSTNGGVALVVGQLAWKNYSNNHTIFDASAGTSPDGGAVNNTNAAVAWTATYPTLMGWNGSSTYGVRVDSARLADNSTLAGGLAVHTSTNNEANKIVRTDGNGYIQAGWINTTSGDNGTTTITRVYASNDNYIRTYTPANFATAAGLATKTYVDSVSGGLNPFFLMGA